MYFCPDFGILESGCYYLGGGGGGGDDGRGPADNKEESKEGLLVGNVKEC